jgi:hypothetical protein
MKKTLIIIYISIIVIACGILTFFQLKDINKPDVDTKVYQEKLTLIESNKKWVEESSYLLLSRSVDDYLTLSITSKSETITNVVLLLTEQRIRDKAYPSVGIIDNFEIILSPNKTINLKYNKPLDDRYYLLFEGKINDAEIKEFIRGN